MMAAFPRADALGYSLSSLRDCYLSPNTYPLGEQCASCLFVLVFVGRGGSLWQCSIESRARKRLESLSHIAGLERADRPCSLESDVPRDSGLCCLAAVCRLTKQCGRLMLPSEAGKVQRIWANVVMQ